MHIDTINRRKVIVTRADVAAFNAQWPCSRLRASRHYWFEFDSDGGLSDTDCPEQDDGPEAGAVASACLEFLDSGEKPGWAE